MFNSSAAVAVAVWVDAFDRREPVALIAGNHLRRIGIVTGGEHNAGRGEELPALAFDVGHDA